MQNNKKTYKDYYYMYGKHAVLAALNNPKRHIKNILCTQEVFSTSTKLISKYKHEIILVETLNKLLGPGHAHQGIAAYVQTIFSHDLADFELTSQTCCVAILDQITDPQNIGAIIRSSASFGVGTIIMPEDNSPNENATIAKAAAGTLEQIQIIKVTNLKRTIEYLKKHGFWVVGLDTNATNILNKTLLTNKLALVLGSEDTGMRRLTKEACDYHIKIPISNKVESLNVSNAAAIVFYYVSNSGK